ncbi:Autophagy- protein 9A [Desmophyllum pertusum]|uniref:Autophagy-related protein 9 n=1 Tax=Desmophyllum pertusum TaxID=174260 RepID=A0A9X0A1V6_9CNID|nr:Autophagy- protein 9A [Desmophyllum pertusum]
MAIIAKNMAFFCWSLFAVLTIFTLLDKDVNNTGCYIFVPDENSVWDPEQLLKQIVSHTHYIPDTWKGKAHTREVREKVRSGVPVQSGIRDAGASQPYRDAVPSVF